MDETTRDKINLEISKIDTLVDKSALLLSKCKLTEPDFFDLNAIGSILHSFYNGLESVFKLIHKATDNSPLASDIWHSQLFYSMFDNTEKRKAVLSKELSEPLKDYLGFRHVFRHSYSYELDWERLNPLFSEMKDTWLKVKNCIVEFLNSSN